MYICLRCTRRERLTVNRRAPGSSRRTQLSEFCSRRCLARCSLEGASEITTTASSSSRWAASSEKQVERRASPPGHPSLKPASMKVRSRPYDKKIIKTRNIRGAFMTEPTYEELKARLSDLEKQVETKKRSGVMEFRVSEKGGVSVYGLGRFPVTLYYEQWIKLLDAAPDLKVFIEENKSKLKTKQG